MIFSSWKEWSVLLPDAFQILLQLLFAFVLCLTPSRLCTRAKLRHWFQSEPLALASLAITALLLTHATGHALGSGALCLALDVWRKRSLEVSHPLDVAFSIWAITVGLLLAEAQYVIAFIGTIVPCFALWVYGMLTQHFSQPGYLLIRISFPNGAPDADDVFRQVQAHFDQPLVQVFRQETNRGTSFGLAVPGIPDNLSQLGVRLQQVIPAEIGFDLQPVSLSAAALGRWV